MEYFTQIPECIAEALRIHALYGAAGGQMLTDGVRIDTTLAVKCGAHAIFIERHIHVGGVLEMLLHGRYVSIIMSIVLITF